MAQKKARQTFEKLKREQAVREKRQRKLERKEAAKLAKAAGLLPPDEQAGDEIATEEDAGADAEPEAAAPEA
jgi:hypothetical protein